MQDPDNTVELVPIGKQRDEWWSARNYDVFAILGNVRNGTGFAGVKTGSGFEPLSDHRGKPEDMSVAGQLWFEHHGGEHSASWVSLDEVMRYDWKASTRKTGVVSEEEFVEYIKSGSPQSWSGDVGGGGTRKVSIATMHEIITGRYDKEPDRHYYTTIVWTAPILASCEQFLQRMKELAMTVGERPTRLVFDFDS